MVDSAGSVSVEGNSSAVCLCQFSMGFMAHCFMAQVLLKCHHGTGNLACYTVLPLNVDATKWSDSSGTNKKAHMGFGLGEASLQGIVLLHYHPHFSTGCRHQCSVSGQECYMGPKSSNLCMFKSRETPVKPVELHRCNSRTT